MKKRIRTISALLLGCVSVLFAMAGCAREDADVNVLFADRLVASEEYEVVLEETLGGDADAGKDLLRCAARCLK